MYGGEAESYLHVGDTAVVKLWRFDPSKIVEYTPGMKWKLC